MNEEKAVITVTILDLILKKITELNENIIVLTRLFEKYDQELFEKDEDIRTLEVKQNINRSKSIRGSSGR